MAQKRVTKTGARVAAPAATGPKAGARTAAAKATARTTAPSTAGAGAAGTPKSGTRRASARGAAGRSTIQMIRQGPVALIALNRPDVHNAFDERMIAELTEAVREADADAGCRAIVLLGAGRSFCSGADLDWMRRMAEFSREENVADAMALATMLSTIAGTRKPTIARVHGSVYGGGVGLVAACDVAIAAQDTVFALSEARLGLIPATISPYVIEAIGPRAARRLFLTAERFSGADAYRMGLVDDLVLGVELDAAVDRAIERLLEASPAAQASAKALVRDVAGRPIDRSIALLTAERIADARASDEGREGVRAFLERRKPAWVAGE